MSKDVESKAIKAALLQAISRLETERQAIDAQISRFRTALEVIERNEPGPEPSQSKPIRIIVRKPPPEGEILQKSALTMGEMIMSLYSDSDRSRTADEILSELIARFPSSEIKKATVQGTISRLIFAGKLARPSGGRQIELGIVGPVAEDAKP